MEPTSAKNVGNNSANACPSKKRWQNAKACQDDGYIVVD
jgi:hypothetical protein